jgi:hypothetical protein
MKEVGFVPTGMAWNGGKRFWPDWNGWEKKKSFLAGLEWFGMEEVSFVPIGMAWNGGSPF